MQLKYYHEAVEVVANAIDKIIEDRESLEDAYATMEDAEQQVRGWMMEEYASMPLLHIIRSTQILIEENT